MGMDRGLLARIDRKLLAGLGGDEAYRTVRVPAGAAKWSTWRRYCESVGVSMGRAVALLIDRELIAVFGDVAGDDPPLFAQRAREQLKIREAKIVTTRPGSARSMRSKHGCAGGVSGCDGGRMNSRSESGGWRWCRSSRRVTRPFAPRSDATNAARAGPVASTSTAMARPAAEHNDAPMSRCWRVGWTGLGWATPSGWAGSY
jgi:hypothetical protein